MNERIIQQLVKLQVNYEKEWELFSYKDNDFALFEHEYNHYYAPLIQEVFPPLVRHLNFAKQENLKDYFPYIKYEWQPLFQQQLKKSRLVGSQFINKLSKDLIVDFSHLLRSYTKAGDDKLKKHFLNQFFINKGNSIAMLIKNNPELGFKTINQLNSPQLQFAFINHQPEVLQELQEFFKNCSKKEFLYMIARYCEYPYQLSVKEYFNQWIGGEFIHIKFCKIILNDRYNEAKLFARQKNDFYLSDR